MDLTPFEQDLLDAFEGAEYRRSPVAVIVDAALFEADAYLPAIAVPQAAHEWSLSRWQLEHKQEVFDSEIAVASELRARLIAIRPN